MSWLRNPFPFSLALILHHLQLWFATHAASGFYLRMDFSNCSQKMVKKKKRKKVSHLLVADLNFLYRNPKFKL